LVWWTWHGIHQSNESNPNLGKRWQNLSLDAFFEETTLHLHIVCSVVEIFKNLSILFLAVSTYVECEVMVGAFDSE